VFLQGRKKIHGRKRERMKLIPNVSTLQVFSMKTMKVKNGFDAKNV
jgi:hypothetical protein